MAVNPFKIFLFLLGGSVAAGATAFVSGALDPYLYGKGAGSASVANAPEPAPSDPAAPKEERLPGAGEETPPNTMAATPPPDTMAATPPVDAAPPPDTMAATPPPTDEAATPPAADAPPAGPQPPSFDIVRVEADGSVVVAGKAMADALVELLHGEAVLGSSRTTPEGDFVIVLDVPLKPGDYQLSLRATPAGGTAVASVQTAVLSVPDQPGGQVLAMVEEPGKASELITVPEAPAEAKTEEPATPPVEDNPADVASAPAEATPPSAEQPKPEETAQPPAEEEPAEVASAPDDATQPADDNSPATEAPKVDEAVAPPADADKPSEEKPAEVASAPAETPPPADATPPPVGETPKVDEAAAPPAEEKPAEIKPAPAEAKVAVEAVEIEGSKVFVAGAGDPGRYVRVYANEIVLGETVVDQNGRFLIEAVKELPVGQYMIRADLLDAGGAVIARAVVPFEREEGEAIAAVAPEVEQPPAAAQPPADSGAATPPAVAEEPTPPAEPAMPQPEQPAVAADEPAQPEQPAVAGDQAPPAPQPEQPEVAAAEAPPADNPPADAAAQPSESEAPAMAAAEPEQPAAPADAGQTPAPGTDEAAAAPPAEAPEEAVMPPPPSAPEPGTDVAAAQPPETVAPKLMKVQGSVIIRRGDTLWRISRRVYGHGVRFSTIYLANQKQIADPHWIWPGQVFRVPEKTQEGEPADMSAMGNQMIMTPEEAGTAGAAGTTQ